MMRTKAATKLASNHLKKLFDFILQNQFTVLGSRENIFVLHWENFFWKKIE